MQDTSASESKATILVVDDEELWRGMLSQFLTANGYTVMVARDGREGLQKLEQESVDLVLLDLMMPEMDGQEVLRHVREQHASAELPIIMATVKDSSRQVVTMLNLGANDYLTKPFDFPVVLARVETHLSLKRQVDQITQLERSLKQRNLDLESSNQKLVTANERMKRDLDAAAETQASMLPEPELVFPGANFISHFVPCDELAGDHLNVLPINDHHVCFYVLDVVGHGVPAALLAVTANGLLNQTIGEAARLPKGEWPSPSDVARLLARKFPMERTGKFFTIVYCDLDLESKECRFTCAGHPGPVVMRSSGQSESIDMPGFPIGISDEGYTESELALDPGDRLFLFSDGIIEARNEEDEEFGQNRLVELIEKTRAASLGNSVAAVTNRLTSWIGGGTKLDDVTLLALEVS